MQNRNGSTLLEIMAFTPSLKCFCYRGKAFRSNFPDALIEEIGFVERVFEGDA